MKSLVLARSLAVLLAAALALPGLAGCAAGPSLPPFGAATSEAYRLDSGDRVRVIVFGQDELTGAYTVDASGAISMPLIRTVTARGLTTAELEDAIGAELEKGVVRNPNVSVQVEAFRPLFVLGEVRRPGLYPYVHGMTVLTAVAVAGGFTERAQKRHMSIVRTIGDSAIEARVERHTLVRPGDVVFVLERFF